ncbi:hypothetical protein [Flavobacterium sp. N1994]|uniref:hypothetical protein n=1 Tax=Flavobacterium sp. N1994 TaxID=2986827 RepID=UPI0022230853|nr:hypothetical protein [Flavobacterium sp. N1994]
MKNTILYLVFICLLVSQTGHARSIEMGHIAVPSTVQQPYAPAAVIQKVTVGSREDVFTYCDDYDEYDCDDHETVIKDKAFVASTPYPLHFNVAASFVAIPFSYKAYHHVNFSRLPRFNYISLKVFRL